MTEEGWYRILDLILRCMVYGTLGVACLVVWVMAWREVRALFKKRK